MSYIVTIGMIEDLLHRNKVDIERKTKEIKEFNKRIKSREDSIEELEKVRVGLLKELEKVKQEWETRKPM